MPGKKNESQNHMYLHAGDGRVVRERKIIGIFDLDTATVSQTTKEYLRGAEKAGVIEVCAADGLPKSFILTAEKIYMTRLNTSTLKKRSEADSFSNLP